MMMMMMMTKVKEEGEDKKEATRPREITSERVSECMRE